VVEAEAVLDPTVPGEPELQLTDLARRRAPELDRPQASVLHAGHERRRQGGSDREAEGIDSRGEFFQSKWRICDWLVGETRRNGHGNDQWKKPGGRFSIRLAMVAAACLEILSWKLGWASPMFPGDHASADPDAS
jgi:hypothetical protein